MRFNQTFALVLCFSRNLWMISYPFKQFYAYICRLLFFSYYLLFCPFFYLNEFKKSKFNVFIFSIDIFIEFLRFFFYL